MRTFVGDAIAIVLCIVVLMSSPATASDEIFESAVAAFRSGNYATAAELFTTLTDRRPAWAPGRVTLGQCHYMLGSADLGDENIRLAAEVDPETDLLNAYAAVGNKLYRAKRYADAIAPLERALDVAAEGDSRSKSTSYQLAQTYLLADRAGDAREAFVRHHDSYGFESRSGYNLALACRKLGDDPCAIDTLRRAIETMTEDASNRDKATEYLARWSRSWAFSADDERERNERLTDAVSDTRAWYELDPNDDNARSYYAETALAAGRTDELLEQFLPAAEANDGNCSARLIVARAYNALPDGPTARRWAQLAASCDPSVPEAHVELAAAYVHLLHAEYSDIEAVRADRALMIGAADALERALKLDSDDDRARALLADARTTLDRLHSVESDFTDQANLDASDDRERIRQRCLRILWKKQTEAEALTPEEQALDDQHDCKQYVE